MTSLLRRDRHFYRYKTQQGRLQGGSGRNVRPVWLKGAKNSTIKGGRILPSRGEEFPQIYGSHTIYVFPCAWITSTIRCPHVSDIRSFVPHCMVHPYLDREGVIGL